MSSSKFRKIIAPKFFITLPKEWRESLGLKCGDFVEHFSVPGSPLILIPKGHELSALEKRLIGLLTSSLSPKEIDKLIDQVGWLKNALKKVRDVT